MIITMISVGTTTTTTTAAAATTSSSSNYVQNILAQCPHGLSWTVRILESEVRIPVFTWV
jgi:hypothetical protein